MFDLHYWKPPSTSERDRWYIFQINLAVSVLKIESSSVREHGHDGPKVFLSTISTCWDSITIWYRYSRPHNFTNGHLVLHKTIGSTSTQSWATDRVYCTISFDRFLWFHINVCLSGFFKRTPVLAGNKVFSTPNNGAVFAGGNSFSLWTGLAESSACFFWTHERGISIHSSVLVLCQVDADRDNQCPSDRRVFLHAKQCGRCFHAWLSWRTLSLFLKRVQCENCFLTVWKGLE